MLIPSPQKTGHHKHEWIVNLAKESDVRPQAKLR